MQDEPIAETSRRVGCAGARTGREESLHVKRLLRDPDATNLLKQNEAYSKHRTHVNARLGDNFFAVEVVAHFSPKSQAMRR